ncbi:NfeD family protein [Corynebacterium sp. sy017]|uniref:NfeD family protein n=1 Tax=unclassified Corynebacterium TaxID=2624378 RepID=UPI001184C0AD|nr:MULTISPECIES: NfeD family protein [unclassified Corynebacterium]MBP3087633.1 NfeD family protein [Corynebacterium sp. sy017]QDZ42626.1 NfeD family protein [Corynebacterium sp. sy039]TSD92199.1 NfeD family protein [Corynebacterium sp. SY003]
MGAIIWLVIAAVLVIAELAIAGELTALMLGAGALATAGIALLPVPLWAELVCFSGVSFGLLFFLKPILKRHMTKNIGLDTSPRALLGQKALVVEPFRNGRGMVRLDGSLWSARTADSTDEANDYEIDQELQVVDIDGNTAVVWKGV